MHRLRRLIVLYALLLPVAAVVAPLLDPLLAAQSTLGAAGVSLPVNSSGVTSLVWSAGVSYRLGAIVSYSSGTWISVQGGNYGNTPVAGGAFWQSLGGSGGSGGAVTGYTNAGSSLSSAVSAAGSAPTVLQISQGITVSSSLTVPSNVTLWFQSGGELLPASGVTITFAGGGGQIQAPVNQQIFGGGGLVSGLTGDVPVEWFGGVGNCSLSGSGADNTAPLNAAVAALTSGHVKLGAAYYCLAGTLRIAKSNVGVGGVSGGYSYPGTSPVSLLLETSVTADAIDLAGTSTNYLVWNDFHDFSIQRTVLPSGTSAGFSCSFAGGTTMNHVQSQDSIRDFYFHACPSDGIGSIGNTNAGWGHANVSGYTSAQTLYGFYLDSADGSAENSLVFRNIGVGNGAGSSPTTHGMYIYGSAINDVDVDFLNDAGTSYGVWVQFTGTNAFGTNAYDLHFRNATLDSFTKSAVVLTNLYANQLGDISFEDGWIYSLASGTSYGIDIENSSGVAVSGMQIGGTGLAAGLFANSSSLLSATGNLFQNLGSTGDFIRFANTTNSALTANVFKGSGQSASSITNRMIALTSGSIKNTVTGNALAGYANYGIVQDGTSGLNLVGSNAIDPSNITVAELGDVNGSCRFPGVPAITMEPGSGTNPGYYTGFATYLPSSGGIPRTQNNCNFSVIFNSGTSPSAGAQIFLAYFKDVNGNTVTWPTIPGCLVTPLNGASASVVTNADGGANVFILDAVGTLAPNTVYGWTVRCGLE